MKWNIIIPNWHPTALNKLVGNWRKSARLKKSDAEMIGMHAILVPKAKVRRRVYLTIGLEKGQRAPDPDAYWKSLLDGLVACEMLVDDSRTWCELAPVEFARGAKRWTTITLENI